MEYEIRLLIVEDSWVFPGLLIKHLQKEIKIIEYDIAPNLKDFKEKVLNNTYDLIILDYNLEDFSAPAGLQILKDLKIKTPVIVISGSVGEDIAIETMRMGAKDYIMKSDIRRLVPSIKREIDNRYSINEKSYDEIRSLNEQLEIAVKERTAEIEAANKILREEIELRKKAEQEMQIVRNQFFSMISHEYRTPLTTIMLSNDLLKRYYREWSDQENNKHFARIQDTILTMIKLMENVLIIGDLDSGKVNIQNEKFEVESFLRSIAKNISMNYSNSNPIEINVHLKPKAISYDENVLGLIVTNLLSNAIKYSNKKIEVFFYEDLSFYYLSIFDSGMGIPSEIKDKIYEPFFRGENVSNIPGFGLGLYIVKKCLSLLRGKIKIKSELDSGTKVDIILPKTS